MKFTSYFFILLVLFALSTPAAYADFGDDCSSAEDSEWCVYRNFYLPAGSLASDFDWPRAPDGTAIALRDPKAGPATALYAVGGAAGVEVSFYSVNSTFATPSASGWIPGYPIGSGATRAKRLLLSEESGRIYLQDGGWWTLERDDYGDLQLLPISGAPSGKLAAYGVTVLASSDGSTFTAVSCSLRTVSCARDSGGSSFNSFYETYSATVPTGTRFLRIELRELAFLPLSSGGSVANNRRGSMRLAQVRFIGDAVRGTFAPPTPSSEPDSSTPSAGSSSPDPDIQTSPAQGPSDGHPDDEDRSSARRSSKPAASSSRRASSASSRTASSRASSAASKGASSKASSSRATSSTASTAAAPEREYAPTQDRSPSRRENSRRTALLGGAYLVGAATVLAYLIKKKF